ncbi:TetR/AcrR family transcriptional regulator [Pseudonocardia kongjuensis]|uniref:TetR/AcrR family transcriptional regulator n=2 Tax=Pseudonocardia kongjuensis TaxID=102227 RepID=A0ABN1XZ85_9PSEU
MLTGGPTGPDHSGPMRDGTSETDATAARILVAARRVAEEFGLRRFTMDEVARQCDIARVTVYRYFPRKDELIRALVLEELRLFTEEADKVVRGETTVDGTIVVGVRFCVGYLRSHVVLNRLLRTEPEVILPHLTTSGGPVLAMATEWIGEHVRREMDVAGLAVPPEHAEPFAELLVRTVISLVLTPGTLDLDSDEGWERVRRLYVAPFVAMLRRDG